MADLWYRQDAPKIAMIYGSNPRWDSSEAELLLAAKYDLIITASPFVGFGRTDRTGIERYNDNLKRLHDMNPRLKVLAYFTGGMEFKRGTKYFSDDRFLRSTEGEIINSWPGSCMLNLADPETIRCFGNMVADLWPGELAVDGVYLDTMCGSFDKWAVEIATKKKVQPDADGDGIADPMEVLDRQWLEGKRQILENIRAVYGEKPYILVNAKTSGDYARPYADGDILEDCVDHQAVREGYFERLIEQYLFWSTNPSGRPNCTYINATPGFDIDFNPVQTRPFDENNRVWQRGYESLRKMRFGLAFALMGDGHYTFQLHSRHLGEHWWYQEYDIPIGKPLGGYYRHEDGTYRREYENAIVVLNNTCHEIQPHFDRTMRDGTTSWVGKDFWLPAKDGRIYVRVGL